MRTWPSKQRRHTLAQTSSHSGSNTASSTPQSHNVRSRFPISSLYKLPNSHPVCYTGAQVAIAGAFINYVVDTREGTSSATAARFLSGAQGAFALGRFIGSFLMSRIRPRWVFLVFMTCCIIFIAPSITQRGNTGMSMLYVTLFFESIIFPTIVALGMRGLGKYSKRGSGFIVGGVCGGAVVPPILFAAADSQGQANYATGHAPTAIAMSVPLAFFVAAWTYTLAVNFAPAYRNVVDSFHTTEIGVVDAHRDEESGAGEAGSEEIVKSEAPVQTSDVNATTKVA